ncbi:MAG: alpha-amylase [Erysipelotrichaceae bacterium]
MQYLNAMCKELSNEKKHHSNMIYNYVVPQTWNLFGYQKGKHIRSNELIVNPYDFYEYAMKSIMKGKENKDYLKPISVLNHKKEHHGEWIKSAMVYSTMIRTTTSWDHDRSGDIEVDNLYGLRDTGTFLKSIILLPYYKRMGINTLYLLPVSLTSKENIKGDFGSPYAVSNFFKLDPLLQDSLIPNMSVEDQFKAFIEACHMLDIHIVIDIIPRTNAIHSQFIAEHPEWFYWIKASEKSNYQPPMVPTLRKLAVPNVASLPDLYASEDVLRHIEMFQHNPKETFPIEFEECLQQAEAKQCDLLDLIEEKLDLTIAPAFSDQINDPQPAWSDVTYFRMYLDHPKRSLPFLKKDYAPYILNDTIKANWHPGKKANQELWDIISDIIPFYQKEYGIDGVRIDMGHALPIKLVDDIIKKARAFDSNICIIAEELDPDNAIESKQKGYNMILGNGFSEEIRIWDYRLSKFVYSLPQLPLPAFACGETHDTPRIAQRDGGEVLSKLLTIFNLFIPNAIPFINSGQEFYERQPMNTGLDCDKDSAYVLDKKDPRFGKLALFDRFYFDYTKDNFNELPSLLEGFNKWRNKYIDEIVDLSKHVPVWFDSPKDYGIGFTYIKKDSALMIVANCDVYNTAYLCIHGENLLPELPFKIQSIRQVYSTENSFIHDVNMDDHQNLPLAFIPGEVKCIEFKS